MMKVTIFQTDIRWADPQENVRQAQQMLTDNPGSDLYVLPEMWATGFATKPQDIAEEENASVALRWMRQATQEHDCAICGSLAVRTQDGRYWNRQYFVTPNDVTTYDKHHLFTYGHEDRYISAGDRQVIAEWRGQRFLLLTCYDLRFPVWARYGRAGEYDAIICVANWPESRQEVWHILLRARAIENQCYVIGCNRVGDDPNCHYVGHSAFIDSRGRTMAECEDAKAQTLTAEIDMESLHTFRNKFKVLNDRDAFILQ